MSGERPILRADVEISAWIVPHGRSRPASTDRSAPIAHERDSAAFLSEISNAVAVPVPEQRRQAGEARVDLIGAVVVWL